MNQDPEKFGWFVFLRNGGFWVAAVPLSAPFICYHLGGTLWQCFLSLMVTAIFTTIGVAIWNLIRPKTGIGSVLLNINVVAIAICILFYAIKRRDLEFGAARFRSVLSPSNIALEDGRTVELTQYVPDARYFDQITSLISDRLAGKRVSPLNLKLVSIEIVKNGFASASDNAERRIRSAQESAKQNRYGIWGGNSEANDRAEYARLRKIFDNQK